MYVVFPHSDYYAPFDCLQGLGAFGAGLPYLLPTLLVIPCRLSRVQNGGLKQDDVGGVLLAAPSALCGSPVPAQGKQVCLCLLPLSFSSLSGSPVFALKDSNKMIEVACCLLSRPLSAASQS